MSVPLTPLPASFTVRLTMEADWHVGSGTGRPGSIDRLVIRDEDGLPYVPAKTLTGIWRDACERLAFGLDDGIDDGAWSRWVEHVFGEQPARRKPGEPHPERAPLPAALSVRAAHYSEDLRRHLRGDSPRARAFQSALTFVQPGVKIDEQSGRADDEHLRFVEMARGGAELTAGCRMNLANGHTFSAEASALLLAGAKLVERLGGKRRRGAGRCRLDVLDAVGQPLDVMPALDWLDDMAAKVTEPQAPAEGGNDEQAGEAPRPSGQSRWLRVPLTIELLTPLAVGYRTVGNVMETLDFIPGTYLLPHVTRVLEACGIAARPAIARGDVRVLNATLCVDGEPGRPVPFCLEVEKGVDKLEDPSTITNLLAEEHKENSQYKPAREGYLGPSDGKTMPRHATVAKTLRTHNTVEEESQRPTEDVGGVYSYEAIASRQNHAPAVFRCELRLRSDLIPRQQNWWDALAAEIDLGRSKKDDYGRARLTAAEPVALDPGPADKGSELFVWLLSDLLLRDAALRLAPNVDALKRALQDRLNVTLEIASSGDGLPRAFTRVRRVESWNVGWKLPRPTLAALQAGSCVRFQVTGQGRIDPQRLADVEAAGLGERTAEGFGQVALNDPFLCGKPTDRVWELISADLPTVALIDEGRPAYTAACRLEEEVWREAVRRSALGFAAKPENRQGVLKWTGKKPPMSQLGALRDAVRSLQEPASAETILRGWLRGVKETKNRRDKWPDGALAAIGDLLSDKGLVWQYLREQCPNEWHTPLTTDAEDRLEEKLWAVAVRSLIDACVRVHKREQDAARVPAARGEGTWRGS